MPALPNSESSGSADLNLRLLRHLVRYLVDHYTPAEVEEVAHAGGISVAVMLAGTGWVSIAQFEGLLAQARELIGDEARFVEACAYKLDAVSGPIKFMVSAVSPVAAYKAGAKNMFLVSAISTFEPEHVARGHLRIRYRTTKPESRLMCLSRRAQIRQLPTTWNLPPAHVTEHACVARGDECCLYEVHVYEGHRWLPLAIGALLGLAAGAIVQRLTAFHDAWWSLASVGVAMAFVAEVRRTTLSNRQTLAEINEVYLQTAREEANARKELYEIVQRQKVWLLANDPEPSPELPVAVSEPAPTPEPPATRSDAGNPWPYLLRREGEFWTVVFEGRTLRLRDSRGMQYVDLLLRNPGVHVHAIELASGPEAAFTDTGTRIEVSDERARRAYRDKLNELVDERDEAEAANDTARAAALGEAIEAMTQQVASAYGLGGRGRTVAAAAERARVNVTRAISTVIRKAEDLDPSLGHFFKATLRTGTFCHYASARRPEVTWRFDG